MSVPGTRTAGRQDREEEAEEEETAGVGNPPTLFRLVVTVVQAVVAPHVHAVFSLSIVVSLLAYVFDEDVKEVEEKDEERRETEDEGGRGGGGGGGEEQRMRVQNALT